MAAFSTSDVFTKLVALTHPLGEVFAVRGLFTVVLVGAVMGMTREWRCLRLALGTGVLARSLLDAASSALYVAALLHLPMTDVSAVLLLSPVIVTLMAVLLLREDVDARRWLAVLLGFAGVLLIVRPAPASFNAWAIVALGAALASSFRDVMTRKLDPAIPTTVLTLASMCALTLVGVGLGSTGAWLPLSAYELVLLLGGAAFFGLAIYFVVMGQKETHARAANYSITSSARSATPAGISCPIAFAVFMLTTSSNVVGCSTGISEGLAPRRTLTASRAT